MIKKLCMLCIGSSLGFGVEYKHQIDLSYMGYSETSNEVSLYATSEATLKNDFFTTHMSVEYLYRTEHDMQINELYISKTTGSYKLLFGKRVDYWGELEGYNVTDIFNQKNYLLDPFDKSKKIGSWALSTTKYLGEDSIELGVKFYEDDQKYPDTSSAYYPFPLNYNSHLQTESSKDKPSFYLSYVVNTESFIESENRISVWHGYDNKRYFIPLNQTTLAQYAYRVNKYLFSSNVVYDDMIFKVESSYTDVINDISMSDYLQWSVGMEKSFFDISGMDITLYAEYYRYKYIDENSIKNVDVSEIYNNDFFLAMKLNINDTGSSEIKSGIFYDRETQEKVFKIKMKTRVKDSFLLHAELLRLVPAKTSLLSTFENKSRAILGLTYTF